MSWTKESAITEIEFLMNETLAVASKGKSSSEFTRWFLRSSTSIEEIFGGSSKIVKMFRALKFSQTGLVFVPSYDIQGALDLKDQTAFYDDLNRSYGIFQAGIDELSRKSIDEVYKGKDTPKESSIIIKVLSLAENKLRKTIRNKPDKEKEIQDAYENLLIAADIPYKREHPHIRYSSKDYIPDFSFEKIDLALEVKLCARERREKEIIAEINDDIMAYKSKFSNVAFIIYDVGMIRDVDSFTDEFCSKENILIRVIKH